MARGAKYGNKNAAGPHKGANTESMRDRNIRSGLLSAVSPVLGGLHSGLNFHRVNNPLSARRVGTTYGIGAGVIGGAVIGALNKAGKLSQAEVSAGANKQLAKAVAVGAVGAGVVAAVGYKGGQLVGRGIKNTHTFFANRSDKKKYK